MCWLVCYLLCSLFPSSWRAAWQRHGVECSTRLRFFELACASERCGSGQITSMLARQIQEHLEQSRTVRSFFTWSGRVLRASLLLSWPSWLDTLRENCEIWLLRLVATRGRARLLGASDGGHQVFRWLREPAQWPFPDPIDSLRRRLYELFGGIVRRNLEPQRNPMRDDAMAHSYYS